VNITGKEDDIVDKQGNPHRIKINNPPNPPYININIVEYYATIYNDPDKIPKLKMALLKLSLILNMYDFYVKNYKEYDGGNNDAIAFRNLMKYTLASYYIGIDIESCNLIIKIIKNNNSTTLIGSIESTEYFRLLPFEKIVCSDKISMAVGKKYQHTINHNLVNVLFNKLNSVTGINEQFLRDSSGQFRKIGENPSIDKIIDMIKNDTDKMSLDADV